MWRVLIGFLKWISTFLKGMITWLDESLMVAPLPLPLFAELAGLGVIIGAAWLAHGKNTEKMNRMGQFAAVVGGIWCPFAWDWVSLKWIPVCGIVGWCSFKRKRSRLSYRTPEDCDRKKLADLTAAFSRIPGALKEQNFFPEATTRA